MTDQELMEALLAEGLPVEEIAEKFEMTLRATKKALGLSQNRRSARTRRLYIEAIGYGEYRASEVAAKLGIERINAERQLRRFVDKGHATMFLASGNRRFFKMTPMEDE